MTQYTVLSSRHNRLHAQMVDFAGWNMPVQYDSITAEYQSVRDHVGIFDVSHMGRFKIEGHGAAAGLSRLVVSRMADLVSGQVRYTMVCNPEGGIKDDILVSCLKQDTFLVVVNASNREKLLSWFKEHLRGKDLLHDATLETGMVAIQGPQAEVVVGQILQKDISSLGYYHALEILPGIVLSRTGYTGENGFEISAPPEEIQRIWDQACSLGAKPCGLGARDILRLEMGFPLYGHELSEEISPLEAGLKRVVHFDKPAFIGKEALQAQEEKGIPRRRIGFQLIDRGIPRENGSIYDGDHLIGRSTSGGFSPLLKKGIGLALVDNAWKPSGTLTIEIRGKKVPIEIKKTPFVPKRVKQ